MNYLWSDPGITIALIRVEIARPGPGINPGIDPGITRIVFKKFGWKRVVGMKRKTSRTHGLSEPHEVHDSQRSTFRNSGSRPVTLASCFGDAPDLCCSRPAMRLLCKKVSVLYAPSIQILVLDWPALRSPFLLENK